MARGSFSVNLIWNSDAKRLSLQASAGGGEKKLECTLNLIVVPICIQLCVRLHGHYSCLNYSQIHDYIAAEHISQERAEPELRNDADQKICTLK